MASLKENYNEERNKNESLKRFKEMKVESESKTVTTSNVLKERSSEQACFTETCHIDHTAISAPREKRKKLATTLCPPSLQSCSREPEKNATGPQKSGVLLPDLNLPLEVDSDSDTLYGMS
ncbi:hypothetical protein Syun_025469 [Stephania yunnanensis]|uniref:Uncharacterized protein n=1 Tax=Stephania yunnanensis TaxID=152371 RepID=A0AAP0F0M0_9MAGN